MRGGAMTLPMLWQRFGSLFTAQKLMYYYQNCPKMVKPKPHPVESPGVRASDGANGHCGDRALPWWGSIIVNTDVHAVVYTLIINFCIS